MAEEVDPAEAALGDGESIDSGITDVTCDADTPIDSGCVVTRDKGLSPDRRIAYRAQGARWITARIVERRDADKRPAGADLNPDRGPIKASWAVCTWGTGRIYGKGSAQAEARNDRSPLPKKKKKRKSPDDPNLGDSQRDAGQLAEQRADRQRSRGPAVAAAAARFQGTSAPTPKEPAPRRGPTPGRTHRTGWVPNLEGRTREASSTKPTEKLLATTPKVPGAVPRDKAAEPCNTREKKRQDFDISAPQGTPRTPRGSVGATASAARAAASAAPAPKAAPRSAGQPAR
eukprot:6794394-Pyramimonas_sp.AAC.1